MNAEWPYLPAQTYSEALAVSRQIVNEEFTYANEQIDHPLQNGDTRFVWSPNGNQYILDPYRADQSFLQLVRISRVIWVILTKGAIDFRNPLTVPLHLPRSALPEGMDIPFGLPPPMLNHFEENFLRVRGSYTVVRSTWNKARELFYQSLYFLAHLYLKYRPNEVDSEDRSPNSIPWYEFHRPYCLVEDLKRSLSARSRGNTMTRILSTDPAFRVTFGESRPNVSLGNLIWIRSPDISAPEGSFTEVMARLRLREEDDEMPPMTFAPNPAPLQQRVRDPRPARISEGSMSVPNIEVSPPTASSPIPVPTPASGERLFNLEDYPRIDDEPFHSERLPGQETIPDSNQVREFFTNLHQVQERYRPNTPVDPSLIQGLVWPAPAPADESEHQGIQTQLTEVEEDESSDASTTDDTCRPPTSAHSQSDSDDDQDGPVAFGVTMHVHTETVDDQGLPLDLVGLAIGSPPHLVSDNDSGSDADVSTGYVVFANDDEYDFTDLTTLASQPGPIHSPDSTFSMLTSLSDLPMSIFSCDCGCQDIGLAANISSGESDNTGSDSDSDVGTSANLVRSSFISRLRFEEQWPAVTPENFQVFLDWVNEPDDVFGAWAPVAFIPTRLLPNMHGLGEDGTYEVDGTSFFIAPNGLVFMD